MSMPLVPPFAITGAYQNSQMAQGTYVQGGSQVFSHLVNPPASGVEAEVDSDEVAHAVGFAAPAASNEVQLITLTGATGGTFTLTFGDNTTAGIAYNAAASAVQSALAGLARIGAGTAGTNEVQTVTITGAPTGGTFTLTLGGQTTAGIAFNAAASAVQTALQALSTVGANNATVTGAAGGPYTVTFVGALAGTNVAQMTASGASLTGGTTPGVTVATGTAGVAGAPNVAVAGSAGGPYTVTFSGRLTNEPLALIGADGAGLTPAGTASIAVTESESGDPTYVNQALQNAHQQFDPIRNFGDSSSGNHF